MGIGIGDVVNVKNLSCWEGELPYWKGKVIVIENGGRKITVQDRGINFAEIDIDDLISKDGQYWEK